MSRLMRHPLLVTAFAKSLPLLGYIHTPSAAALLRGVLEATQEQPASVRDQLATPACRLIDRLLRKGEATLAQSTLGAVLRERIGLENPAAQARLADLAPEIARRNGEAALSLLLSLHEEAARCDDPALQIKVIQRTCAAAHAAADAGETGHVGPLLCLAHAKARTKASDTLPGVLRTMITIAPAVEPRHLGDVFDRMFLEDSAVFGADFFESGIKTYTGMTKRLAKSTPWPNQVGRELRDRVRLAMRVATDVAHKRPKAAHLASRALIASLKLARDLGTRLHEWDGLPRQILCETFNALTEGKWPGPVSSFGHAARDIVLSQTQYHPREVPVFLAEVVGVCSTDPLTDPRDAFVSTLFALTEAYDGKRAAVVSPADSQKPPVVFNGDSRMPRDRIHTAFDRLAVNERLLIPNTQWCREIGHGAPSFVEAITTRHENALIPF